MVEIKKEKVEILINSDRICTIILHLSIWVWIHALSGVHHHHIRLSSRHKSAVHLHTFRSTANISPAEEVLSISSPGTDLAAVGIKVFHFNGFAKPARDTEKSSMPACTADPAVIAPPTVTQ